MLVGKVGERVRKYEERIDENIKAINEGIKGGDYYPHYLMESFMKIEKIMEQDRASLIGDYEKNQISYPV